MSPTTSHTDLDSSGHLPVETIADHLEDLLPPDTATRVEAHLADCPECLDTRAALEEVRSLLGETERPVLPEDIALRIDAALTAEAEARAQAQEQAQPAEARTTQPESPRKAHSGPSAPPAGPGGSRGPGGGPGRRGTARWRRVLLGVAGLSVVGLITTAVLNSGGSEYGAKASGGRAAVSAPKYEADAVGPFTAAGFTQQVQSLLASPSPAGGIAHPQAERSSEGVSGAASGAVAVPPCAEGATGHSGETPLAVATGSYQGVPVFAFVYPDPADTSVVDAYLVDASCTVRLHRTVPRD